MTNENATAPAPQVIAVEGGAPIKAWTAGVPFEPEARAQLERIARLPFIHRHVAVMPDVHLGKGRPWGPWSPPVRRSSPPRWEWTSAAA